MKTVTKRILIASVAGALCMGAVGSAQADALATSVIRLSNFQIQDAGGTAYDASAFQALVPNSSADASASLNGVTESFTGSDPNGQINFPVTGTGNPAGNDLCVGSGCPAFPDNTWPIYSSSLGDPTTTFAAADQNEAGAPITGLGVPLGATVEAASYVSLPSPGNNVGSATVNNNLGTSFVFTLASAGSLTFQFDALRYLEAYTSAGEQFPTSANASSTVFFKVEDLTSGAIVFEWHPDGVTGVGSNCVGCTAETDAFDLNSGVSRNSPFPFTGTSFSGAAVGVADGFSPFSATSGLLAAGTPYQLTALLASTADAERIPEPGILALLGAGLLGMGGVRRFGRKAG